VIRGGYGRNLWTSERCEPGANPLLSPVLSSRSFCTSALNYTTNTGRRDAFLQPNVTPNVNTAFRIGTDGTAAPIPAATPTLPQPYYPGIGGKHDRFHRSPLDPNFKPNSVDSFDISIQHQFTSKITVEVGGH